jgi:hypothetical protein
MNHTGMWEWGLPRQARMKSESSKRALGTDPRYRRGVCEGEAVRRSIDDAATDQIDDFEAVSWAVAISDDYDDTEPRVVLTVEEVGRAGYGIVAHLTPDVARRLRVAVRDALREIGEPTD